VGLHRMDWASGIAFRSGASALIASK